MKIFLILISFSFSFFATGQEYDAAWVANTYSENFRMDTRKFLATMKFVDEKGIVKTIDDYKGKILYIDIWTTWCGPCRLNLEMSKQLFQRLQSIQLDTAIQFINICTEDSKKEWKKIIKASKHPGVNLYSVDTTLYESWEVASFPTTILLDASGKILAKKFTDARNAITTDYLLYMAQKGIEPADAIWIKFRQDKYFEKHLSYSLDEEGKDYSMWFNSLNKLFYEHHQINQQRK